MNYRYPLLALACLASLPAGAAEDPVDPAVATAPLPGPVSLPAPQEIPTAPMPQQTAIFTGVVTGAPAPEDSAVKTSALPKLREAFAGHEGALLKYRNSYNLPEITNPILLERSSKPGQDDKAALEKMNAKGAIVGTVPRLKFIPCDEGCQGNGDYDAAVKSFVKLYEDGVKSGKWAYRGEMALKVRWFHQRTFFEKNLPLFKRDIFAISYPLEGKLVTISGRSMDKKSSMEDTVGRVAMIFNLGMLQMAQGGKPGPLQALLPEQEQRWLSTLNNSLVPVVQFLDKLTGNEDRRSRIEPMSEADNALLPAIDGIRPNEVEPLKETFFLNSY